MQKSKIEWTQYVWNPVKGMCPQGCFYCYARAIYKRFKWNPKIRITDEYPGMVFMPFFDYPKRIFVCSTFELFHPSVKKEWRDWIFDVIEYNDRHTFQILTKLPQNIDREMPDNVWLGVSVTSYVDYHGSIGFLREAKAKTKFMSIEPLLKYGFPVLGFIGFPWWLDWVIVGKLTGHGKKYDPKIEWIQSIIKDARDTDTPVFLKDNLIPIVGQKLVSQYQEFPE